MHVVAVIPAFNEESSVGEVVAGVRRQGIDCIVVDDGSRDGTADVARAAGATVMGFRRNQGLGRVIRRGYEAALATGAEVVVQLDADGQYDPADIPALIAPIVDGHADLVLGSRLEDIRYDMPALKRWGNRAFSWVLRRLTRADVRDGQTGFRAIHREALEASLPINEFSYTQEMIIRVAKEGFRIKSVDIPFHPRRHGESRLFNHPVSFAFRAWWIIIRTWRDYHPFRFFFWPGLLILAGALTLAGIVGWHVVETGRVQGRLGTLVGAGVLFLLAFQMMLAAIQADMIRTHTQHP